MADVDKQVRETEDCLPEIIFKSELGLMRTEQEVNTAVERYADMVRRLCLVHLKNRDDAEDIFQTVFIKLFVSDVVFESA